MEESDGMKIMHCRKAREYRLPELARFSVNRYCSETRTVNEFFGCNYHGHSCQAFRDFTILRDDTLSARSERTMLSLEQITREEYLFKIQWECEYDVAGRSEMLAHSIVPLSTRDALYGSRTEGMRLHYKGRENETIQLVDVMSL